MVKRGREKMKERVCVFERERESERAKEKQLGLNLR